jgi:hypothetical protein
MRGEATAAVAPCACCAVAAGAERNRAARFDFHRQVGAWRSQGVGGPSVFETIWKRGFADLETGFGLPGNVFRLIGTWFREPGNEVFLTWKWCSELGNVFRDPGNVFSVTWK